MFWDISIVYIHSAKATHTIRYNSNTSELRVIELFNYWNHMFELLKVEKVIIFFKKFACSNY